MNLLEIIEGGYCVGCGLCAVTTQKINIHLNEIGMYEPNILADLTVEETRRALLICPFSDLTSNETVLAREIFEEGLPINESLGKFSGLFAGYVEEGDYRNLSTSGGIITWLLCKLIDEDLVDYVIHVKPSQDASCLFAYGVSKSPTDVKQGAKSRYYPIQAQDVLRHVMATPGRYAFVGLPCFIKGIRNLARNDSVIAERIVFTVGLVCGHLKSTRFAELFASQMGFDFDAMSSIDFRVKLDDRPANHYGVSVSDGSREKTVPVKELIGANWGHNLFRIPACNYCDDVFAETADICVGDAWLPEFEHDPRGTSLIITRNQIALDILQRGKTEGAVNFSPLSEDHVISSQAGGLRDRREGLAYRLYLKKVRGLSAPRKRVHPSKMDIGSRQRSLYEFREFLGTQSHLYWHKARQAGDTGIFLKFFQKMNKKYISLYFDWKTRLRYKFNVIFESLFSR